MGFFLRISGASDAHRNVDGGTTAVFNVQKTVRNTQGDFAVGSRGSCQRGWTMIEARVTGKVSTVATPEVLAVVAETDSAFPETMVIHRDAIDAVPVGTELIDRVHFIRLQAEISALRGLTPAPPPRPPEVHGLPRYGLRWNGPDQPLAVPMEDGYWTPWHLADQLRTKNTDGQEILP